MSVIRKKPYIEKVLEKLTSENFESLKSVVNGSGSQVQASFSDLPESAVTPVIFKIAENDYKNGILVLQEADTGVEEVAFLIAYHRFQDLQLYSIDLTKHTIEKINEYCDINELRRLLVDSSPEPTFENIYANNVFADDEFEFSSDTGDFGERAKGKIREVVGGKRYFRFVLQETDPASFTNTLQLFIEEEDMEGLLEGVSEQTGQEITTPEELVTLFNTLKGTENKFSLAVLFYYIANICLSKNLNNIYFNSDGFLKIVGSLGLAGLVTTNGAIFSEEAEAGKISFASNSSLNITLRNDQILD